MKSKNNRAIRVAWIGISPWLIIGAMVILVPLFIFMTLDNINKQREHTIQMFQEKADTLIRSFEAGARTEMMGRKLEFFHLQKLLLEMAQQPDIDFIAVTNTQGVILADSDPSLIGDSYGKELDLDRISRSGKIEWRLVPNQDGIDTFEAFRRFSSFVPYDERFHEGLPVGCSPAANERREEPASRQVIFIGLSVGPIEMARKDATRHTILMAVLLLFIGISGIVSLFFAQGYRSARVSLSRIKAFSDNLVRNMPIGLIALDRGGNIISFNQTAESILQLASPEVLGKNAATVLPLPFQEIIGTMDVEKGIIDRGIACHSAEGKTIHLEIIATVLKEDNGNFLGYVLLFKDATEVRYLKREIVRSQHLASLGNLAAGIAHEIRNPLSSIKGFATYFKERYRDNPKDGETADIMVREVDRLNRVISQLLEFARPMPIEKKPTSLPTLIRQSLKMIENQSRERNISVHTDLAEDIPEAVIDEDKIKQVLLNLYLNALETMEPGSALTVKLTRFDSCSVNIAVSDGGTGIDEKDMAHIFDPYFTTKPSGTGLGLSIVHRIIEAHDGEIGVTSKTGEGTTFSILLPVRERRANLP
ncbi:MAG TPA: ATP-binding protein [Syntrophales bacterium]|nr:ATP-binding protein [Syntrophales bacterium]